MKLPQLVIFDMDGLIFDTERLFMEFLQKNAADFGYTITPEQYTRTLGIAGQILSAKVHALFGPDYPHEQLSRMTRADMNCYADSHGLPVKDGIPELLQFLKEAQVPCCVASSTHAAYVERYLTQAGLASYFSLITGGDQVHISKPDPEIFLLSCRHFGIEPEHALVLEDSENGLLAAHNGKIPAICIPDLKYPDARYREYALCIAKNAFEVLTYFSED